MKYTISNVINKPLEEVIEKFTYADGAFEWMEGLQRIEPTSGKPLEVGPTTDFHFIVKGGWHLNNGRKMKISETILEQNLPNQIKFAYHSPTGYSEVEMLFDQQADGATKQTSNSYFELKGLMKYFGFLMKGSFKKQSMKYLCGFKGYVEK